MEEAKVDRAFIRRNAVHVLSNLGWTARSIGIALGRTPRWVRGVRAERNLETEDRTPHEIAREVRVRSERLRQFVNFD